MVLPEVVQFAGEPQEVKVRSAMGVFGRGGERVIDRWKAGTHCPLGEENGSYRSVSRGSAASMVPSA
ncbi:MAG: hypothetical protein ACK42I_07630 [Thermomicrobium sp.]